MNLEEAMEDIFCNWAVTYPELVKALGAQTVKALISQCLVKGAWIQSQKNLFTLGVNENLNIPFQD